MIDLKQEVISDVGGGRYLVTQVELTPSMHNRTASATMTVAYSVFIDEYSEYIDPKDIEIDRLNREIQKLKEKKKPRKKRRMLSSGEIKEIRELILKGEGNTSLGIEYQISDSAISKIRVAMRKEGQDV